MNLSTPRFPFLFFATGSVLFHSWLVRVCPTGARRCSGAATAACSSSSSSSSLSVSSPVAQDAMRAPASFLVLSFALCGGLAELSGLLVNATTCQCQKSKRSGKELGNVLAGLNPKHRTCAYTSRTCDPCVRYPPCHWTTRPFCQSSSFSAWWSSSFPPKE